MDWDQTLNLMINEWSELITTHLVVKRVQCYLKLLIVYNGELFIVYNSNGELNFTGLINEMLNQYVCLL